MGVIRIKKDKNFSIISNFFLRDKKISLKAKGFLTELLSKPDDWEVRMSYMIKQSKDGKDSHYSALKELIKAGYIKKIQIRNVKGQIIGTEYEIHETSVSENPDTVFPDTVDPDIGCPDAVNRPLLKTNTTKNRFNKKTTTTNIGMKHLSDNHQPTNINKSSLSSFFDDIVFKFNSKVIQNAIQRHLKSHSPDYIKKAILYANVNVKNNNSKSYLSYLNKTIENDYAKDYQISDFKVKKLKIDKAPEINALEKQSKQKYKEEIQIINNLLKSDDDDAQNFQKYVQKQVEENENKMLKRRFKNGQKGTVLWLQQKYFASYIKNDNSLPVTKLNSLINVSKIE